MKSHLHHLHHLKAAVSLNLIKTLFISWALGFGLSFITPKFLSNIFSIHEYYAFSLVGFLSCFAFMCSAWFCYRYFKNVFRQRCNMILIAALIVCMIISSWFNWVFAHPDNYWIFFEARYGKGISWKNIYRSVEILCLIKVGIDVSRFCYFSFICRNSKHRVIISNMYSFLATKKQ